MKKHFKEHFLLFIINILMAIFLVFIAINIFWVIYAFVKYGNTPIAEVPAWAIFYMFGGR